MFDVEAGEFFTGTRYDSVDLNLEGLNRACIGANVAGVDDAIATNGDANVVLFLFVWFVFAENFGYVIFPQKLDGISL